MKRACYVLKFILAEQVKMRQNLFRKNFRVIILATSENIISLPEFTRSSYNFQSNRSSIVREDIPLLVVGEEMLLCDKVK